MVLGAEGLSVKGSSSRVGDLALMLREVPTDNSKLTVIYGLVPSYGGR